MSIAILEVRRIPNSENAKTKCPVPSPHEGDMDGPPRISRQRQCRALRRRLTRVALLRRSGRYCGQRGLKAKTARLKARGQT